MLAVPVLVPVSMALVFRALKRRMRPAQAYNLGFAVYWAGWCTAFPVLILGPRNAWRLLHAGARPSPFDWGMMILPTAGAVMQALVPNRKRVTPAVACVMAGSAAINAVCEELLWRGLFVAEFGEDFALGFLWPLAGFSLWHLAPQIILPSETGRWRFVLGAGIVGAGTATAAWHGKGVRWTLLPHIITDACGVRAAEFRLGRGC